MLIESMRDIGYTLETALADVIDNAISAEASRIEIFADSESSRIGILDDGKGMSSDELLAAMKPGSRNPLDARDRNDLGRFGLGLKTASFSQCRRLTIVSRQDAHTHAAVWDLDYVAATDDWLIQLPHAIEAVPWSDQLKGAGA